MWNTTYDDWLGGHTRFAAPLVHQGNVCGQVGSKRGIDGAGLQLRFHLYCILYEH